MADQQDSKRPTAEDAPELHNSEQEDEAEQSQTLAVEARHSGREASPLDSSKTNEPGEIMDDASQDLIDKMRDMEQSGRIDMGAYRGEQNLDDNEDKYAKENKEDDLPSDGS